MNIPKELEAEMVAKGAIVTKKPVQVPQEPRQADLRALAEAGTHWSGPRFMALIPVCTTSEVNSREWKARNRRAGEAWRAVSKILGPNLGSLACFAGPYRDGRPLYVTFTRLGGRRLDRSNLPTATKAVEDALAFMLGADDGDPRWVASWDQEPGGPQGVRITLSLEAKDGPATNPTHATPP